MRDGRGGIEEAWWVRGCVRIVPYFVHEVCVCSSLCILAESFRPVLPCLALSCLVLSCIMLCSGMFCSGMLCYVMLRYVMLCYFVLCYIMLCNVI